MQFATGLGIDGRPAKFWQAGDRRCEDGTGNIPLRCSYALCLYICTHSEFSISECRMNNLSNLRTSSYFLQKVWRSFVHSNISQIIHSWIPMPVQSSAWKTGCSRSRQIGEVCVLCCFVNGNYILPKHCNNCLSHSCSLKYVALVCKPVFYCATI